MHLYLLQTIFRYINLVEGYVRKMSTQINK